MASPWLMAAAGTRTTQLRRIMRRNPVKAQFGTNAAAGSRWKWGARRYDRTLLRARRQAKRRLDPPDAQATALTSRRNLPFIRRRFLTNPGGLHIAADRALPASATSHDALDGAGLQPRSDCPPAGQQHRGGGCRKPPHDHHRRRSGGPRPRAHASAVEFPCHGACRRPGASSAVRMSVA
jgi:hypothetical protein